MQSGITTIKVFPKPWRLCKRTKRNAEGKITANNQPQWSLNLQRNWPSFWNYYLKWRREIKKENIARTTAATILRDKPPAKKKKQMKRKTHIFPKRWFSCSTGSPVRLMWWKNWRYLSTVRHCFLFLSCDFVDSILFSFIRIRFQLTACGRCSWPWL